MEKKCYGICDKCKGVDVAAMKKAVLEIEPNATFDIKCQSNCGPGMHETFVLYNDKFYIGEDEEEVIEQLSEDLNI